MENFSNFLKIWKIQLTSRLPLLIRGAEETVYTVPRLLYGLYSAVTLLYWSVIAIFSTVILIGSFSYQLGASTRRYLHSPKSGAGIITDTSSSLLEQTSQSRQALNQHPDDEVAIAIDINTPIAKEIAIANLTPNAIKKVRAIPPDQTVWVRRWGKGWQVAAHTPPDRASWLVVNRSE